MTAPRELAERIGRRAYHPIAAQRMVQAVLGLHQPRPIYHDCGHDAHEYNPDGSLPAGWVDHREFGLVCEQGYLWSICTECCTDAEGHESRECREDHEHSKTFICNTIDAITKASGVQP